MKNVRLLRLRKKTHHCYLFIFVTEIVQSDEPLAPEEKSYYDEYKQYYCITGKPLIPDFSSIHNYDDQMTSVLTKVGIEEDFDTFNVKEFLKAFCNIMHLNIKDIRSIKLEHGSVILNIMLDGAKSKIKLLVEKVIEPMIDKIKQDLAKLKVFFMPMGDVDILKKAPELRQQIKLHPQWNRTYGQGHTYWTGPLNDGKDRGKYDYFSPVGWKRYALDVSIDFEEKFKGWSICYHGTKFQFGLAILLSGLMPAQNAAWGSGIYASQSIIYACHPRYAEVKEIKSAEEQKVFKNGKYIQFILQCRVHSDNIKTVKPETLRVANGTIIDPNLSNDVLE